MLGALGGWCAFHWYFSWTDSMKQSLLLIKFCRISPFLRDSILTYYYTFFPWLIHKFVCWFFFIFDFLIFIFLMWCFFIFFSWNLLLVNNFSVMSGCFLGRTSSKHKINCLAQGQNILHLVRLGPATSSQSLFHWATAHLGFYFGIPDIYCYLNHTFPFQYHLICLK